MRSDQASSTALLIAKSTVISAGDPQMRVFVDPQAAELCARFIRDNLSFAGLRLWAYRQGWYRWTLGTFQSWALPGIQLHYALRKKMIEELLRREIQGGCRRVQVLGAGFDTLALRLAAQNEQVQFVEVDHPDTQRIKKRSVPQRPKNLSFQALDLDVPGADLAALSGSEEPSAATVVVAEGVLMYLEAAHVQRLFQSLEQVSQSPLTVIFTFMAPDEEGKLRFHRSSRYVDWWLKWKGEPFRWGSKPSELGPILAQSGYRLIQVLDHKDLRALYLDPLELGRLSLAEGELLAVALRER